MDRIKKVLINVYIVNIHIFIGLSTYLVVFRGTISDCDQTCFLQFNMFSISLKSVVLKLICLLFLNKMWIVALFQARNVYHFLQYGGVKGRLPLNVPLWHIDYLKKEGM